MSASFSHVSAVYQRSISEKQHLDKKSLEGYDKDSYMWGACLRKNELLHTIMYTAAKCAMKEILAMNEGKYASHIRKNGTMWGQDVMTIVIRCYRWMTKFIFRLKTRLLLFVLFSRVKVSYRPCCFKVMKSLRSAPFVSFLPVSE